MSGELDEAVVATLRRLAGEAAPRLLAEAVAEGEAEFKDLLRRQFVRCLADSVTAAAPRPEVPAPVPAPAGPRGWYVYGITDGPAAERVSGLAGIEGSTTEAIVEGDLAAVVSEVAARRHGWGLGPDGEPDLESLAPRVRQHEQVLEQVLEQGTVLPMRFGTVYPTPESVRRLLAGHARQIGAGLARLRDKAEWGLLVTWDAERALGPAPADAGDGLPDPGTPGRGYLSRQRAERDRTEQLDLARQRLAAGLHDSIRAHAADAVVQRPAERPGGDDRPLLLRASYLVARPDTDAFRRAILDGLETASDFGVGGELTGPWPPYSFIGPELAGVAS